MVMGDCTHASDDDASVYRGAGSEAASDDEGESDGSSKGSDSDEDFGKGKGKGKGKRKGKSKGKRKRATQRSSKKENFKVCALHNQLQSHHAARLTPHFTTGSITRRPRKCHPTPQ